MLCVSALAMTLAVSAATERRLYPDALVASSFVWTDWNQFQENYHPNYIADDDAKTAWVEGAKGTGVGEWVRFNVTKMEGATKARLSIRNGYQKSAPLFAANARVEKATVTLLPSGVTKDVVLSDMQGFQDVVIEQPVGALHAIELKIVSVYAGKKYEDTCISDVDVYVTATTAENPAFEKTHFEKLQAWRKERIEAAKMFAKGAKTDVPIAASYTFSGLGWNAHHPETTCKDYQDVTCAVGHAIKWLTATKKTPGHEVALAFAARAAGDGFKDFTPVQVVVKDKRKTPTVDYICTPEIDSEDGGVCHEGALLPRELGYLRAETVGTFAVTNTPGINQAARGSGPLCQSQTEKTFGWAKTETVENGPARLRALLVVKCGLICSRDGLAPAGLIQLLVYDDKGQLELIASEWNAQLLTWSDGPQKRIVEANGPFGVTKMTDAVAHR